MIGDLSNVLMELVIFVDKVAGEIIDWYDFEFGFVIN